MSLAFAIGLAWVLMRRRRTLQKARAADIYWLEKRRFLEERAAADAIDAPPEDWSGRLLDDRFLLEERIAGGGFAAVYRAADQCPQRRTRRRKTAAPPVRQRSVAPPPLCG